MKILIVDDDALARVLLHRILSGQPEYTVVAAEDATAAFRLLENPALHFDAAIIDIVMPDHDGFWLVEALRELDYRVDLPIALCSASNDTTSISRARKIGIKHYILKPFRAETLVEKVKLLVSSPAGTNHAAHAAEPSQRAEGGVPPEAKHLELLADLRAKTRHLSSQVSADYQGGDIGRFTAQFKSFGGVASNLGQPDLARIFTAIGLSLQHEVVARSKLRFALSTSGLTSALATLDGKFSEILGPDETSEPTTVLEGARPEASAQ